MINNVTLTGRLTKDVELKYTPSGVPVASLTLAVNRTFANEKGEKESDFLFCVAWRKTAETMANYLKKGSLIGITGRLQTRSYEDGGGKRQFVTEVVIENFTFLESKGQAKPEETKQPYHPYGA